MSMYANYDICTALKSRNKFILGAARSKMFSFFLRLIPAAIAGGTLTLVVAVFLKELSFKVWNLCSVALSACSLLHQQPSI